MSGFSPRARTISTICCWAMPSSPTSFAGGMSSPQLARTLPASAVIRRQSISPHRFLNPSSMKMFSATLIARKRFSSWKTLAMPDDFACCGEEGRYSFPFRSILPEDAGWTPATILSSVLLPAPFAPTRPTTSPAGSSKPTSCSASKPPKLLPMPEKDRTAEVTTAASGNPVPRRGGRGTGRRYGSTVYL